MNTLDRRGAQRAARPRLPGRKPATLPTEDVMSLYLYLIGVRTAAATTGQALHA